jgi:hypothetical protein
MPDEDLKAELERLKAENQALKERRRTSSVSMKVSEKKGPSRCTDWVDSPSHCTRNSGKSYSL